MTALMPPLWVVAQVVARILVLWAALAAAGLAVVAAFVNGGRVVLWAWQRWMQPGDTWTFERPPTIRRGRPW